MTIVGAILAALAAALAAYELHDAAQERKRLRRARARHIHGERP